MEAAPNFYLLLFPDTPRGIRAGHTKHTYTTQGRRVYTRPPKTHSVQASQPRHTYRAERGTHIIKRHTPRPPPASVHAHAHRALPTIILTTAGRIPTRPHAQSDPSAHPAPTPPQRRQWAASPSPRQPGSEAVGEEAAEGRVSRSRRFSGNRGPARGLGGAGKGKEAGPLG